MSGVGVPWARGPKRPQKQPQPHPTQSTRALPQSMPVPSHASPCPCHPASTARQTRAPCHPCPCHHTHLHSHSCPAKPRAPLPSYPYLPCPLIGSHSATQRPASPAPCLRLPCPTHSKEPLPMARALAGAVRHSEASEWHKLGMPSNPQRSIRARNPQRHIRQ